MTTLLGFLAALCTTSAFFPQAVKVWKTKRTRDISLVMYLVFVLGVALWMTYGIIINDLPVLIANALTLLLGLTILVAKLRYG